MSEKKGLLSYLTGAEIKQFISYFIVGGVSALVEWISFFLLGRLLNMPYLPATALAFVFSTTINWFLGRTFTFKNSKLGKKKGKEFIQVFGVSGIGLLANLGLMFLFAKLYRKNQAEAAALAEKQRLEDEARQREDEEREAKREAYRRQKEEATRAAIERQREKNKKNSQ